MTEIKNSVTLTIPAGAEDYAKTIWAAIAQDARREARHWIAKQIEEQTDPVVAEPTEWGSVVRARRVGYGSEDTMTLRWQRHNKLGDAWISEPAGDLGIVYHSDWSYLVDPEVLRVGIGETYPHASGDAVVLGPETVKSSDGAVINHKGENYYPRSDGDGSYNRGRRDAASAIHRDVSALRDSTPLVTERRAYDKILAVIAVLRGES